MPDEIFPVKTDEQKQDEKEFRDYTKERDDRCYKTVQKLMKILIDEKIFITDLPYLRKIFHSLLQEFAYKIIIDQIDVIFNITEASLQQHLANAAKVVWGKDRDDVTIEDVHKVLTKNKE